MFRLEGKYSKVGSKFTKSDIQIFPQKEGYAYRTAKPLVAGSNPAAATSKHKYPGGYIKRTE